VESKWGIKFERGQVVILDKSGVPTRVRVVGVTVYHHNPKDPMYEVSELETGIRYPAMQHNLKAIPNRV
jgi:hypothetical protein